MSDMLQTVANIAGILMIVIGIFTYYRTNEIISLAFSIWGFVLINLGDIANLKWRVERLEERRKPKRRGKND